MVGEDTCLCQSGIGPRNNSSHITLGSASQEDAGMRSAIITASLVFLLSMTAWAQTTIDSTWDGTTDVWTTSAGWDALGSGDLYPNNNVSYEYNVVLPAGAYVLSTSGASDLVLLTLDVGAGARLGLNDNFFSPGGLVQDGIIDLNAGTLELALDVTNHGVIRFDLDSLDTETISVAASLTIDGTGRIVMRDNDAATDDPTTAEIVIGNGLTLTHGVSHAIEGGPGRIRGDGVGAVTLVNAGEIRANAPLRTLRLDAFGSDLALTNTGVLAAEELAVLHIVGVDISGDGILYADGGLLDLDDTTVSGLADLILANSGVFNIDSSSTVAVGTIQNGGGYVMSTGTALTTDDYSGTGALTVDSTLTVNDDLVLAAGAWLDVLDGVVVNVGDRLDNQMTAEGDFDFNTTGELRFTSATGADPDAYALFGTLETASEDQGDVPAGYTNNFALARLTLAPGAKINLVDLRDNGNRGGASGNSEALYVDTLTFEDSSGILNLNGLHLYYNTLVGDPLQIKDSSTATPATWICENGNWSETACWDQLAGSDTWPDNNTYEYSVYLPEAASPYTVTGNVSGVELTSLDVAADATFVQISAFTPGVLANEGTIELQGGALNLATDVLNDGTIQYDTDSSTEYVDVKGDLSLLGYGTLQFQNTSGGTNYRDRLRIYDGYTLTNGANHSVLGGYALVYPYSGSAAFVNDGTLRCDQASRSIEFETTGGPGTLAIANNQVMAAEGGGILIFDGADVVNTGTISADGSSSYASFQSNTTLDNASGTLQALNDGSLYINATIASAADLGTFDAAGGAVSFGGTIDDTGTWLVDASYGDFGTTSGASITGLTLDTADGQVFALRGTTDFTDVTIATTGVVENQAGILTLAGTITNEGMLRYDDDYGLEYIDIEGVVDLDGAGTLQFQNTSGSTSYRDRLRLYDGAVFTQGSDHTMQGGYAFIERQSGDVAFVNDGTLRSDAGRQIEFETTATPPTTFTITNNNLMVTENASDLRFDGTALVNTGTITADGSGSDLLLQSNTTLDNESGTLRAVNGGRLDIDSTLAEVADLGTFDAASGTIEFGGTLDDTGTWLADDSYGDFCLTSGANLAHVTLDNAGVQVFALRGSVDLTDVSIATTGVLENQSGSVDLIGTITNDGVIRYDTDSSSEYITIRENATLAGTGVLQFQSPSSSVSYQDRLEIHDGATLTHGAGHTIEGGWAIVQRQSGDAAFVNDGTIRSNNDRQIEFETNSTPASTFTVTNNNLMSAEAGGDLLFDGVAVVNAGTLAADSAASVVTLDVDTTFDGTGGTLQATNDGTLRIYGTMASAAAFGTVAAAGGAFEFHGTLNDPGATWLTGSHYGDFEISTSAALTGITLASVDGHVIALTGSADFTDLTIDASAIVENQGGSHELLGTFTNDGLLRFDTDSSTENFVISESMTMAGDGTLLFQNPSSSTSYRDRIYIHDGVTLTNGPDHHLVGGYAWIMPSSSGATAFVNEGEVRCNVDAYIHFENTSPGSASLAITNNGEMIAENGGELRFEDTDVVNAALMHADGADTFVRFQGATTLDNTAGTLRATDGGHIYLNSTVSVAEVADLGTFDATGGSVTLSPQFNEPGATWIIDADFGDLTFGASSALTGVTLQSPDNHLIQSSSGITLTDVTIDGPVLELGGNLDIVGTFTNDGTVQTDTDTSSEYINITDDLDLAGSGTMHLRNPSSGYRDRLRLTGDITVTNTLNHTIEAAWAYIERVSGNVVFVNDGTIRAATDGTALTLYNPSGNYTDFLFTNNGQMVAEAGGDISMNILTFVNADTIMADGSDSQIGLSSGVVFDNDTGLVAATNSGRVTFSSLSTDTGGDLSATAGGRIELSSTTITTSGTITVAGGTFYLYNATLDGAADLTVSDSGLLDIETSTSATLGSIVNNATVSHAGDLLTAGSYAGAGVLDLDSDMVVTDDMVIAAGSDVSVSNGIGLTVGGDYDLQMIYDVNYDFGSTGELAMTGGVGAALDDLAAFAALEVAGQDLDENDDPTQGSSAGFSDNFSLPELIIGAGARVKLVDLNDNGHRGGADGMGVESEALYVNTLTFADTSGVLALDGYRIYYNSTNAEAGQIIVGTDCNQNGIGDNRDVLLGTSLDCNANNIPDECEIDENSSAPGGPYYCTADCDPDCNNNGIPDACDIADCTGDPGCADCNENGVPDECDIAGGASFDINTNGIPDECEADCNQNGIPDECDIDCGEPGGPCDVPGCGQSADCNNNGIPDECEPGGATSTWVGPDEGNFAEPNNWDPAGVPDGAVVIANDTDIDNQCVLDTPGTTVVCNLLVDATDVGVQVLQIDAGSELSPTGGTTLTGASVIELTGGELAGPTVTHSGELISGHGTISAAITNSARIEGVATGVLTLSGDSFDNTAAGELVAPASSTVFLQAPAVTQAGLVEVRSLGGLVMTAPLTNSAGGEISILGGSLATPDVINQAEADIEGFGTIDADVTNAGDMTIEADMQIINDLVNDGTITIQSGILSVLGSLSGSGTIIGDFAGRSGGNGLTVIGDYAVDAAGTLAVPNGVFKIGGDFDLAIDDSVRVDLASATVQAVGLPEQAPQLFEVAAPDSGRHVTLPDVGLFSINRLRVGPMATTVQLVDLRDNSTGAEPEAIYVSELLLEPGVTLDLNGLAIYFDSVTPEKPLGATSGVTVIDSVGGGTLLYIGPMLKGDYDDDADLDLADLFELELCLNGPDNLLDTGCDVFDFDVDTDSDVTDFAEFQKQFTGDRYE